MSKPASVRTPDSEVLSRGGLDPASLAVFRDRVRDHVLAAREAGGPWRGHLSSSALSTTTAVCALEVWRRDRVRRGEPALGPERRPVESWIEGGVSWLVSNQNEDGGFGDSPESPTNISTTTLVWATLSMIRDGFETSNPGDTCPEAPNPEGAGPEARSLEVDREAVSKAVERADAWLRREMDGGELSPGSISRTIRRRYGVDKTFAVPILVLCALTGRFGGGRDAFREIPRLPFELAALPHAAFRVIGLPVVSYALPALIAIGLVQHRRRPTPNPFARAARGLTRVKALAKLARIQPASGGFLEAAPLTSFCTMSLVGAGEAEHPVTRRCLGFLFESAREDGSWPIDEDLATWVTTLSLQALAAGGAEGFVRLAGALPAGQREALLEWLLQQQTSTEHPYTHAAPGGWGWTDRSGSVPDADDTPGALLALAGLTRARSDEDRSAGDARAETVLATLTDDAAVDRAANAGVGWLLDLQNRDGGIPTFCRGFGKLPFDCSSPDLTAHTIRSWCAWRGRLPEEASRRVTRGIVRATRYLLDAQHPDGSWVPLWFGNPWTEGEENPLYGTSRVLLCHGAVEPADAPPGWDEAMRRAAEWILTVPGNDGGFGGGPGAPPSIEETALAVDALAGYRSSLAASGDGAASSGLADRIDRAIDRGVAYLSDRIAEDGHRPNPIVCQELERAHVPRNDSTARQTPT